MIAKTWNVRDQNENELRFQEEKLYKNIEAKYRLIKKVTKIEDAKKIIDEIWRMKKWANNIELELMRREFNNGASE
jgi:hypothetical protein